jgi:O-succinylhomoserine sulfhydrylase
MQAHCTNALQLAQWLEAQPNVKRVHYPGLKSHPQYALGQKQQTGSGGVLSFEVEGGKAAAWTVIDATQMVSITANLGDVKTTITHPATTTHGRLTDEERKHAGISDGLIRVSVGLENIADIQTDLLRGLSK